MVLNQVEYLIHGNILPESIQKFRISDRLILEKVYGDGYQDSTWGKNIGHVKAYVGVEYEEKGGFFDRAEKYLTLFLYLYTLKTGQPYVVFRGPSTVVSDFSQLGVRGIWLLQFHTIEYKGEPPERDIQRISNLKTYFEKFASDYEEIINSTIGLSLQFFYDAIMSNHRWRLDLSIVHFIMAAEALIILEDEGQRQRVSKRIGVLSSDSSEKLKEVYQKMKKLYDVRSGIVHGGGKIAYPHDVQALYIYLNKAIESRLLIRNIPKKELIEKLDQIFDNWNIKKELL
jgi:hypothetical protein